MFASLAGMTLTAYIRRRRLTLAALELIGGEARIIDIAVKHGYDSADSFARAFYGLHGVTLISASANFSEGRKDVRTRASPTTGARSGFRSAGSGGRTIL